MIVPTDVQVCFMVGAFLADVGAPAIRAAHEVSPGRAHELYTRFRLRALAYASVFVGPAATMFFLAWPAWETQYWSSRFEQTADHPLHAMLFALFILLLFVGAWFGNWLGFRWVLGGARKRLRVYLSVLAATIAIVAAHWPAPIRLGTYDEFHANPAALPHIWDDHTFFTSFLLLTVYCALPLPVLIIRARRAHDRA